MINIFIANLDFGITSDDLRTTFSQFGEVSYAHVVYDRKTKKSKGYGYIEMENDDEGRNAISALNGLDIQGRKIDVKAATPKDRRPEKNEEKRTSKSDRPSKPNKIVRDAEVKERRVLRPRRKRNKD